MKKLFLTGLVTLLVACPAPTNDKGTERVQRELNDVKKELALLRVELALANQQLQGLNANLANLGIHFNVESKEDK